VSAGAVSAEHLTYTPEDEIRDVGQTDTIAVVLPIAELIYMTSERAKARALIEQNVTLATAAPWFRMTPGEVIVGATLNAAYSLGVQQQCGSLDVGKQGDLIILDCAHPDEVCLAVGAPMLHTVVIGGEPVYVSGDGT
jgi:imidazolonepropionase